MTSIKDAEKLIQAFFDAETNNDLYQNRIAELRNLKNSPVFWKHLRKWKCSRRNG